MPFFLGRYSNRYQDRDKEIIAGAAHQEFMSYLRDNPQDAPELWLNHNQGQRIAGAADWVGYDGAFASAGFAVSEETAAEIANFGETNGRAMSHGFFGLADEEGVIIWYRSFEVSIIPKSRAANLFTDYVLLEGQMDENTYQQLVAQVGEDKAKGYIAESEAMAEAFDEAGIKTKAVVAVEAEGEIVEIEPPVDDIAKESEVVAALVAIEQRLNQQAETIASLTSRLAQAEKALKDRNAAMQKGASRSTIASLLQDWGKENSPIGKEEFAIDGRTKAAKDGPTETTFDGGTKNILNGLYGMAAQVSGGK